MNGGEIKALRKQLGMTQEEFAHDIGVTFATVNRWENGKSKPSRLALKMLSDRAEATNGGSGSSSRRRSRRRR
jgi:DNA-binding transcriptional regulator YiaG